MEHAGAPRALRLLVLAGPMALGAGSALADISVTALPTNTPAGYTQATILSGDGSTAAGYHTDGFSPPSGIRWNSQGTPSFAGISRPSALSFNGSAVGGTAYVFVRPKQYDQRAAIAHVGQPIEYLSAPTSQGGLMSADANTMVVQTSSSQLWRRGQGFVATIAGMDRLSAMSGDGSTVVGRSNNSTASYWRQSGGAQLIPPPGSTSSESRAVTPDGSMIVGTSAFPGADHAFIWDAAHGARVLTSASGPSLNGATGISADGGVIIGYGGGGPMVWTPSATYLLQDLLHGAGIHDLDGFNGLAAIGLSTDGTKMLVVSDFGGPPGGTGQWIVTVPGPGAGFAVGLLAWAARRRRPAR